MRTIKSLKEGHYFLHSYNTIGNNNNLEIHSRQQMILLKDSFEHPYTAIGYSLIIPESYNESNFNQGDFLYFDGKQLFNGNNNYDALVYAELNRQLIQSLGINNIENKPVDNIGGSRVRSYHVNVGHGNCSIM